MFFLIAGVQPRLRTIDDHPRPCPQCGLHQAHRQRVDHYLSLFFIPLIRVKKGDPFLFCGRCRQPVDREPAKHRPGVTSRLQTNCNHCGAYLDPGFNYCPHCGRRQ